MKKTALALTFISALIISVVAGAQLVNLATANPIPTQLPSITIRSDGSIDPSNATINQNGNVYTLTDNISSQTLDIQCSYIIIDGAGKTLQAGVPFTTDSGITIEANGVTVKNISINQYYDGVDLKGSSNTITGTTISAYAAGINAEGSFNIITENKIPVGVPAVELSGSHNKVEANIIDSSGGLSVNSDYNSITGNFLNCAVDVDLYGNYNNITGNTISGGRGGIFFNEPASLNNVVGNTIKGNDKGVALDKQPNTFYLNNFINNTHDVILHLMTESSVLYGMNVFDNGSVGNYWSGYNGPDSNHDGIGDTYYVIDGNITDRYPLMTPYPSPISSVSPSPAGQTPSPVISVLSPENTSYSAIHNPYITVPLIFETNASLSWIGYSLDGGSNITVTNGTLIEIPAESRSLTLYANDTAGNWATPQTVHYEIAFNLGIPPTEPFPTILVVAVSVTIVAVVAAGLLVYFKKRRR